MASKTYGWDVRNIAKISPKMAQKQSFFDFFSIFLKTVHTIRTKFSTVILHHIMVLYVQFHQIRIAGIGASQKEKDLSRLLYRICGSGCKCPHDQKLFEGLCVTYFRKKSFLQKMILRFPQLLTSEKAFFPSVKGLTLFLSYSPLCDGSRKMSVKTFFTCFYINLLLISAKRKLFWGHMVQALRK